MASPILVGAVITLVAYWLYDFIRARGKHYPPGPIRLPFVGSYLHLLYNNYYEFHTELAKWTQVFKSKVVALFIGPYSAISTGDYNLVKEVLTRSEFDARPFPYAIQIRSWMQRLGVFFSIGNYWLEQRRFSLRYMRDFGFGRRMPKLENVMENEMQLMLDSIKNGPETKEDEEYVRSGGLVKFPDIYNVPFVNAFTEVLTGRPLDPKERHYIRNVSKGGMLLQSSLDSTGRLLSIFPFLGFLFPRISNYQNILDGHGKLLEYIQRLVQDRKENMPEKSEGFLDFYLKEMEARKALGEPTTFSEEQLLITGADFLLPTSTILGTQLAYLILRILHQPEVGEKMYQEILSVVGTDRLPKLDDRINLPYCEATLRESMRIDTTTVLGVPRMAMTDTDLHGFKIPQNTVVVTNFGQMHMDKEVWGDPENFRPERFLNEEGRFCLKQDKSLPFGLGRRVCAGETFARNTLFIYLVGLIQNFKFEVPEGYSLPDVGESKTYALITVCKPYWVKCVPR